MTQHDQISSFIDNELSHDQEQDFLISLASSDGLRKSFRSELVLKNIIHRDDTQTSPSRDLRPAVFATVGIAAIAGASETANAATLAKTSVLKSLFATKIGAFVTASMITVSALGGYAVHSFISSEAPVVKTTEQRPATQIPTQPQSADVQTPVSSTPATLGSAPVHSAANHQAQPSHVNHQQPATTEPINVNGSAGVTIDPKKTPK